MDFRQILPYIAVASGVAKTLQTYTDPLIACGLLCNKNLHVEPYKSDAGLTIKRADDLTYSTNEWPYRTHVSPTAAFPIEKQVTAPWYESHMVKSKNDVGLVLDRDQVDSNFRTNAMDLVGFQYVQDKAEQATAAAYDGHLYRTIQGVFKDHYVRDNSTGSSNMFGSAVTFENDVARAAVTADVDLTATETYKGQNGEKLYKWLQATSFQMTKGATGVVCRFVVTGPTYIAWLSALSDYDAAAVKRTAGDTERDGIKYASVQIWAHMNEVVIVGLKEEYFPRNTGDTGYRCFVSTTGGLKFGVVQKAFNSSITTGVDASGALTRAFQAGFSFDAMMERIAGTNSTLPQLIADETGRLSMKAYTEKDRMSQSALLNCISMSLSKIPEVPGFTNAGHYYLKAQMFSTVVRYNPEFIQEVVCLDANIPTIYRINGSTPESFAATTTAKKKIVDNVSAMS